MAVKEPQLKPDQQTALIEIAEQQHRDPQVVLDRVVSRYLADQAEHEEAMEQVRNGDTVSHEDMVKTFDGYRAEARAKIAES